MTSNKKNIEAFYQTQDILGETYNPIQCQRYSEVPSFMRAPQVNDLNQVDIGLIGIPFDGGLTCRTGARNGPREVRNESTMMRAINVVTGVKPFEIARIADLGDVRFSQMFNLDASIKDIEKYFAAIAETGVMPLAIGGDHSVTYPILKALAKYHKEPIAIIHIDSHTDTWSEYQGSKFHHGAPFRNATEEGLIDPHKTIQIGIRGGQNFADGLHYSAEKGMRVITIEEFDDLGWQAVAAEAKRIVGDSPVYLTFDIDGLDPVYAPGTGTPEAGGITMREAQRFLRELRGLNFIGADLVEIAPPLDPSGLTAMNGATLLFEMLCLLAEKVSTETR
ncbi:MAG: agmatinase [Amphritea sp.]